MAIVVLGIAQTSVLPHFRIFEVQPAVLLMAVVVFAALHPTDRTLWWAFAAGLMVDLYSAAPFATSALSFAFIAYGSRWIARGLDHTTILVPVVAAAAASLMYYPLILFATQLAGSRIAWSDQLTRLPALTGINVVAAIALYPFIRRFERWTRPAPGPTFRVVQ